ncbi:hypothetical protein AVEN_193427-1 [Araneus ventricosus]|uniref:Uncharacterized protein n=1 Tax=Araneus ventricosus TaxID=182803 RepID=A0A4Y2G7Z3_ARAVE|nr:hypothetical protein AVEN_193427-1 [Araneus ventricosus]
MQLDSTSIWLFPPVHHWYQGSRPGGCLSTDCSRRDQTTLTRFLSGHIRCLTFSDNSKCFEICLKCTAEQATPDHILAYLGVSKQGIISNPLLPLDFIRVHRLMDLIALLIFGDHHQQQQILRPLSAFSCW